jgi:hypothetical protein
MTCSQISNQRSNFGNTYLKDNLIENQTTRTNVVAVNLLNTYKNYWFSDLKSESVTSKFWRQQSDSPLCSWPCRSPSMRGFTCRTWETEVRLKVGSNDIYSVIFIKKFKFISSNDIYSVILIKKVKFVYLTDIHSFHKED